MTQVWSLPTVYANDWFHWDQSLAEPLPPFNNIYMGASPPQHLPLHGITHHAWGRGGGINRRFWGML